MCFSVVRGLSDDRCVDSVWLTDLLTDFVDICWKEFPLWVTSRCHGTNEIARLVWIGLKASTNQLIFIFKILAVQIFEISTFQREIRVLILLTLEWASSNSYFRAPEMHSTLTMVQFKQNICHSRLQSSSDNTFLPTECVPFKYIHLININSYIYQ